MTAPQAVATPKATDAMLGELDLRRQAAIVAGGIRDHAGEVTMRKNRDFDLNSTIFKTLKGVVPRKVIKRDLAKTAFWSDTAVSCIRHAYSQVERPLAIDKPLVEFMMTECNFSMEHADGSFLDHLTFCHDYCATHFRSHSPRVLLLHSILGVGTNYFPMEAKKMPMLSEMLSPEEMKHVSAFPSILRLLLTWGLLDELSEKLVSLHELKGIRFHRVIDNEFLELTTEEFWVHLNYQMVHLLDFAPTADWERNVSQTVFQVCLGLYDFLTRAGQLRATVSLDLVRAAGIKPTIKRRMGVRAVQKYSQEIGHSLAYQLDWASDAHVM
mmetsp:Transcript_6346/g.11775  ORF Transcript_6346/g.11775 Transcript_6346/m.11775 type:complete len:326 (-) Transcript_6346:403-1380(-)